MANSIRASLIQSLILVIVMIIKCKIFIKNSRKAALLIDLKVYFVMRLTNKLRKKLVSSILIVRWHGLNKGVSVHPSHSLPNLPTKSLYTCIHFAKIDYFSYSFCSLVLLVGLLTRITQEPNHTPYTNIKINNL